MKALNFSNGWIVLVLLSCSATTNANDDFQQWMQQQSAGLQVQQKEFQDYRDKRDKEFTAFLKAQWKAVDIVKGEVRDETPKPVSIPVAPDVPLSPDAGQPDVKPVSVIVPDTQAVKKPVVAPPVVRARGKRADINFFGKALVFYFDDRLTKTVRQRMNKETISDYWSSLSRADYEDLLQQLKAQKQALQLNDWAYAALIYQLAENINHKRRNESALLSWFLMTKSGYRARVAYNDTAVYLLLPSRQEMFEVPYFTFSGKRYYAVAFDGKPRQPGRVFTYDGEYPEVTNDFDMRVTEVAGSSDQPGRRHLSFSFEGKQYNIDVNYDRGRIKFFHSYPQLGLPMYFGSAVYKPTATPLQKQLAAYMQGMSEQQAVNFLLRFVQTALEYETDEKQFGEENYLFPEETLFYPYSDCEDRAILFAWLVRSLLNLEVVGVEYPGHVATAVHFRQTVKGDAVSYRGLSYTIADPTYINARVGMTMPDLRQYKAKVITADAEGS